MRITFYKNSFLANVVNILGYVLLLPGIVMLIAGVSDFIIGIILSGIVMIAAGFGLVILAARISARKAARVQEAASHKTEQPAASRQAVAQDRPKAAEKSRSVNMMFQRSPAECGIACLYMILDYYGITASMDQLCEECNVKEKGSNAAEMMRAAKRHGLDCHGFKSNADQLRGTQEPIIIHWQGCHFVVLEKVQGDTVYLCDPAVGKITTNFEALSQNYSGVLLRFDRLG